MRKSVLVVTLAILSISYGAKGQTDIGFKMPVNKDKIEIPIEIVNNLVIIPITVNRFLPLKFVLDTGVETAILTEPEFAPLLQIDFVRKISISGAGIEDSVSAYVSHGLTYELPGGIVGKNMNLLILDEDYLHLAERMGIDVHGIIGYDLFSRFVIRIDYDRLLLVLHNPDTFKKPRRMSEHRMEIINARPFIGTNLYQHKTSDSVKLMIDSGASHAILLDATQTKISRPKKTIVTNLGTGLAGEIPGQVGRLSSMGIADLEFKDVLASIPEPDAYSLSIKRGSRQGTIGGDILSRMNPIFNYQDEKIYLSKGYAYKVPFEFDMSGLRLIAKGTFLDTLVVEMVEPDTPAEEAGIKRGDVVLSINSKSLAISTLNEINGILKKRPNRKVRLRILRNGKKIRFMFRLRRAI